MSDTPSNPPGDPTPPENPTPKPRFEVDADGNIRGVWLTMQVDHFVEFTDRAIPLMPRPDKPGEPAA
jgi:hypothetical protein